MLENSGVFDANLKNLDLENVDREIFKASLFRGLLYEEPMYEIDVADFNLNNIEKILENFEEGKMKFVVRDILKLFRKYNEIEKDNLRCLKLGSKQQGIIKINNIYSLGDVELSIRIDTLLKLNKILSNYFG